MEEQFVTVTTSSGEVIVINIHLLIFNPPGTITIEDFLFTEEKRKLPDYPDNESIERVSQFWFNPLITKISLVILLTICHIILVMLL